MTIPIKPANAQFNDEQWQAIHQKGSNILVAASAGSGKTTVLIERILTHLGNSYAELDELLVVTFTESAAKEMKERMEVSLKKAISKTSDSIHQRHLLQQINLLPTAHIRTLHSFCLQVIQQFFYVIDFNPSFKLLTDETQKTLIYQEVWQNILSDILEEQVVSETHHLSKENLGDLMNRFADARSDQSLFDMVLDLYQFSSSHTEPIVWLSQIHQLTADFEGFKASQLYQDFLKKHIERNALAAHRLLDRALDLMRTSSQETVDKYEALLSTEHQFIAALLEANYSDDLEQVMQQIEHLSYGRWPSTKKTSDDIETVTLMKDFRDDAKKIMTDRLTTLFSFSYQDTVRIEGAISPIIQQLSQLTLLFSEYLTRHKRELNMIDYNDLEHLTLDILAPYNSQTKQREASPAALYFQKQFKEVMVDEYQDINDIQATILGWLAHDYRPDLLGNMFMVGDVKQSIYGFRMAEPSLFLKKYRAYDQSQGGELIVLDKNYRSRDEVLQFTNYLFERIMDTDFGEMDYGMQESLKTGNLSFLPPAPDAHFDIELLLYEKQTEDDEAELESNDDQLTYDSSLEAEVHLVAQDIQSKIADGFEIFDKETKVMRPATFKDIVLLSSTRGPFLPVQQVFEQYHLPVLTQKVENYFQRQEIRLMIALLKIIDNPLQDIPLVAILKSFFVGLSDEMLSKIRIEQPTGLFYTACTHYKSSANKQTDAVIQQHLARFFAQLEHWHALASEVSLVELIWTIYQETNFLDYVSGLANGPQRQANLHAFYQKAAEFEESSFKGLFGFVNYIEKVMQTENDLAEPVILAEDQNVIRTMTVHASKGLEFPIVYLINTGKKFNLRDITHKRYIASKDYGIATDYYDYEDLLQYPSLSKQALKIQRESKAKAEEMRKLYVALTRCEQKLMIVGSVKNADDWEDKSMKTRQLARRETILADTQERQTASTWLDWIRQALALEKNQQKSVTEFKREQVHIDFINDVMIKEGQVVENDASFFITPEQWLTQLNHAVKHVSEPVHPVVERIDQLMRTVYSHQLATQTSSYQSVSELKRMYEEPKIEKIEVFQDRRTAVLGVVDNNRPKQEKTTEAIQSIRYTQDTFEAPRFIEEKQMDYAQIGTITHFFLQQLDFSVFEGQPSANYPGLLDQEAKRLLEEKYLDNRQLHVIQMTAILSFLSGEIGQLVIESGKVLKREKAFSYLLPAKQLLQARLDTLTLEKLEEDQLLVHGVIDNYIQTEAGLVLIDYKTDRFRPDVRLDKSQQIDQIIKKYKFQVSLYAQALEKATQEKVFAAYLVLLDFDETVKVEDLYHFSD